MAKTQKIKPRGKLIVLDGTDGAGKTTQTNLLVETLQKEGYEVEVADFPHYGAKSAGPLEEYLAGKYGQMNPEAASIFYAIDRFDFSPQIEEWLANGKIVVANRYVTANAGHQGGKIEDKTDRLKFFKWLNNLEFGIFGIPKPDLNLILHVPASVGQQRVKSRGKKSDIHEKDLHHLENAEKVYLEIAGLFPNTRLVECTNGGTMLSPQEVANQVWGYVRRIALKDFPAPDQN